MADKPVAPDGSVDDLAFEGEERKVDSSLAVSSQAEKISSIDGNKKLQPETEGTEIETPLIDTYESHSETTHGVNIKYCASQPHSSITTTSVPLQETGSDVKTTATSTSTTSADESTHGAPSQNHPVESPSQSPNPESQFSSPVNYSSQHNNPQLPSSTPVNTLLPLTGFPFFLKLPIELRFAIWKMAMENYPSSVFEIRKSKNEGPYIPLNNNPQPGIEKLCREARQAALISLTKLFGIGKEKEDEKDTSQKDGKVNLTRDILYFDCTISFHLLEIIAAEMEPEIRGKVRFICLWHPKRSPFRRGIPAKKDGDEKDKDSNKCKVIFKLFPNLEKVALVPSDEIRCAGRWKSGGRQYKQMREIRGGAGARNEVLRESALEVLALCWKENFDEVCEPGDEPGKGCLEVKIVRYERFYYAK